MPKRNYVSQNDFISDCEKIIKEKEDLKSAKDNTIVNYKNIKSANVLIENTNLRFFLYLM